MLQGRSLVCSNGKLCFWISRLDKVKKFGFFWSNRIPTQKMKSITFILKNLSPSSMFLIEILWERIEPVYIEEIRFECREDFVSSAHSGNFFRLSELWSKSRSKLLLKQIFRSKCKAFDWVLEGEVKPKVSEKFEFEEWYKSNMLASFGIFGRSRIRATEIKSWFFRWKFL